MKILFTGHRGFLGRELIPELSKKYEILTFTGDLLNVRQIEEFVRKKGITRIIHAAVRGGRRTKNDSPKILAENFATSMNIRSTGVPTLYFCSGALYGRNKSIYRFPETMAGSNYPSDYYGQSKFLFRQIAINDEDSFFMRYFNVFGLSEGMDRFISYNIQQYKLGKSMKIFRDFRMDFFFVKDSIPLISEWIKGTILPKEINMVYEEKLYLSQVCQQINTLDSHRVSCDLDFTEKGLDYCGDGSKLASLRLPQQGLSLGLRFMYEQMSFGSGCE
jgi:nucleoside-diphosphate-sugar epimerase